MATGVSITITAGLDDFSLNAQRGRNVHYVHGVLNYDSASGTALTITAAQLGLSNITGLFVSPSSKGSFCPASVSAAEWTIQPINAISSVSTTFTTAMIATVTVACTVTGVPFLAIGYR